MFGPLKGVLRHFLPMDVSAVILVKPVHIHSFLKVENICKGDISGCHSSNYDVFWDIAPCSLVEID
jgi:hypothetical protein